MKNVLTWFLVAMLFGCSEESPAPAIDMDQDVDLGSDLIESPDLPDDLAEINPIEPGCNPIAHEHDCFFPFPSDFFRRDGRIVVDEAAAIRNRNEEEVDLLQNSRVDGFSPHPGIVVRVRGGFDHDDLIFHTDDVGLTQSAPKQTLLLNSQTGEMIAHFAERYEGSRDPELQYLAIRPLARLQEGTRYVVAIRNLKKEGAILAPPEGFRELVQKDARPSLSALSARYETEVFPVLEGAGVERDGLYLAWDFTVRSRESGESGMLRARELAIEQMENTGLSVHEIVVNESLGASVRDYLSFSIRGELEVPSFVSSAEPDAELLRDDQGLPRLNGTVRVPFLITVPHSVANGDIEGPARVLHFGHGLFGSREEILTEAQATFANELGVVMVAVDWWGFSGVDRDLLVTRIVEDPSRIFVLVERLHQAFINQIALGEFIAETLPNLPELVDRVGVPVASEGEYYVGISAGHILGSVFVALSPRIKQAVLHVGGGSFGLIMTRSQSFIALEIILNSMFGSDRTQKVISVAGELLDLVDPITWAPRIFDEPLTGSPLRRILMHEGLGDVAVPNIGTEMHARALGLPQLDNSPKKVWGLGEVSEGPSALVQIDFGHESDPAAMWRGPEFSTRSHDDARKVPAIREQIDRFLRADGVVENTCGGPCLAE